MDRSDGEEILSRGMEMGYHDHEGETEEREERKESGRVIPGE